MNSNEDQNNPETTPLSLGFLSPADRDYLLFGEGDMDAADLQKRKNSIRDNTIGGLIDFTYLVNLDPDTRAEIFKDLVPMLDQETFPNFENHSERILISPSIYLGVSHCIDFLYTSLGFSQFR